MTGLSSSTAPFALDPDWPESWQLSYRFDRIESWGEDARGGYARMYANRRAQVIDAVRRVQPTPGRALDIAAAQGNFSLALAALGHDVTWNDFRGELIDYVRMKLPPGVAMAFEPGNILDKADDLADRFDLVLALEVVEHVAHPDQFLASVARLVRPGGHIIVSTPNGGYLMNPLPRFSDFDDPSVFEGQQFKPDADGHIFLLHEDEMRSLSAAAGLEVVEHRLFSAPLTCGYLKTGALARRLPDSVISLAERLAMAMPGPLRRRLATASLTVLRRPLQPA